MTIELRDVYHPDQTPRKLRAGELVTKVISFEGSQGQIRYSQRVLIKPGDAIQARIREILVIPGKPNKLLGEGEVNLAKEKINREGAMLLCGSGKRLVWRR